MKAGELYEKGKQEAEKVMEKPEIKHIAQEVKDAAESLKQRGAQMKKEWDEDPTIQANLDKVKQAGRNIVDRAEKITDQAEDYIAKKLGLEEEE